MKSIIHLFEELTRKKCGANGVRLLKLLEGKEDVSEFLLAEKLEMNINELRIIIYKLTEDNLINSIRKKDKEKGWYVYYWTFNFRHARDLLIRSKEKQLEELNHKLKHKEIPKYVCPNGCVSLGLEDAMELEFRCSECNSLLILKEVKYNEETIKKKIIEVEEELEKVRQAVIVEIKVEEKKVVKKKVVKKKVVKKKVVKKKVKKKVEKKVVKKKIKKKVKKKTIKKAKMVKKQVKKKSKEPVKKVKPIKNKLIKKPFKKSKPTKKPKKSFMKRIRKRIKF